MLRASTDRAYGVHRALHLAAICRTSVRTVFLASAGLPHWFGPAAAEPVEILSVHSTHGKRMHVRAAPRAASSRH